ncbi:MAG: DUF1203 domain-containing protein [Pseudomonadota bacterium]
MEYVVTGLPLKDFAPLFALDDAALAARGIERKTVDAEPGYPCRITLRDAPRGASVLLLHHVSHDVETPYRSAYAIYVNEAAAETRRCVNALPEAFQGRPLAFRTFNADGALVGARLSLADDTHNREIDAAFATPGAAYIHAHNAAHGCFAARIDRA